MASYRKLSASPVLESICLTLWKDSKGDFSEELQLIKEPLNSTLEIKSNVFKTLRSIHLIYNNVKNKFPYLLCWPVHRCWRHNYYNIHISSLIYLSVGYIILILIKNSHISSLSLFPFYIYSPQVSFLNFEMDPDKNEKFTIIILKV